MSSSRPAPYVDARSLSRKTPSNLLKSPAAPRRKAAACMLEISLLRNLNFNKDTLRNLPKVSLFKEGDRGLPPLTKGWGGFCNAKNYTHICALFVYSPTGTRARCSGGGISSSASSPPRKFERIRRTSSLSGLNVRIFSNSSIARERLPSRS